MNSKVRLSDARTGPADRRLACGQRCQRQSRDRPRGKTRIADRNKLLACVDFFCSSAAAKQRQAARDGNIIACASDGPAPRHFSARMTNLKFNKAQIHRRGINFGRNGTGGARPRSEKLIWRARKIREEFSQKQQG